MKSDERERTARRRFETAFVFVFILAFAGVLAAGLSIAAHGRISCATKALTRSTYTCDGGQATAPITERPVSVVFSVAPVQDLPQR